MEKVSETIRICDRLDILCHGFFMLGFPTETEEEMMQTIEFAITSRLHSANFFVVMPFDGTEIYDMFKENHPEMVNETDRFKFNLYETSFEIYEIPRKRLQKLASYANRHFFLTPWRTVKLFRLIPHKSYLLRGAYSFIRRGYLGKG